GGWSERYIDRTVAVSGESRTANRASISLGKISAVGAGDGDAGDGQGGGAGVGESHGLSGAGGADLLIAERHGCRREADRRGDAGACQIGDLWAAAGIIGNRYGPAARPACRRRERHVDGA